MQEIIQILMIDDEERFCKTTARLLERHNISVDILTEGNQAILALEKKAYDVVLLDLKMPEISGVDILKQIKKMNYSPEVIILSGHASADIARETIDLDAYDYLLKPCDPEELMVKIFQAYERAQQKRSELK
jgi:DNA-binding NtrC family response regulator